MAKILMVVAPERFRDEELFLPKEEFKNKTHLFTNILISLVFYLIF